MSAIEITIKSSGDTKYTVTILPTQTVLELKKQVEEKSSIPADRQRLIYSGKVLKDAETVELYKVQTGHTIHLVKSAGTKPAGEGSTATGSGAASAASAAGSQAAVPSNIAAGQGSFNPLADLTGARYAGYTQLPSASMFGPDGGMNQNMPDPDQLASMMANPMFQEQMNLMLSNPQMLDYMIQQNPQLRAMGPQVREMLQSPFVRQMMSNPEMMRSMMDMQRMAGGQGNSPAFPAPGNATGEESTPSAGAPAGGAAAGGAAANPFASMFPGGMPMDPFSFSEVRVQVPVLVPVLLQLILDHLKNVTKPN